MSEAVPLAPFTPEQEQRVVQLFVEQVRRSEAIRFAEKERAKEEMLRNVRAKTVRVL